MADRRALWGFHRDGFAVLEQGILGDGGDGGGGDGALSHDAWIAACERRQREIDSPKIIENDSPRGVRQRDAGAVGGSEAAAAVAAGPSGR